MGRLGNINQYEQKKAQQKADALPSAVPPVQEAVVPQSQQLREGFQQMGQMDAQQPVLQKQDPNKIYESTRSQALGSESNLADPQKAQEFWNASPYEYWTEQVKANPDNTYAILNQMYASKETPEEKRKRERREQLGEVFNNLGNLIGNAANLYYTTKGGQYIDLNSVNEKHRARMERLREKQEALKQRQDELLGRAKVGELQAARKAKADQEQREYDEKVRKENRDYQNKKDKQAQDNWAKQFEWNVEQAKQNAVDKAEEKAYRREQDKNNLAYKWAELNFRKERANDSSTSGGKKNKVEVVDTKKGPMNVDFGKLNDTTIAQLYQKIPEEIRKKYDLSDLDNRNERLLRMNEAIGDALNNVEGYADWFINSGIGIYQNQTPKDYSGYVMDDGYDAYMRTTGEVPPVNKAQSSVPTVDDVKKTLKERSERKRNVLQAGKDSLYKNNGYGIKSDTFR